MNYFSNIILTVVLVVCITGIYFKLAKSKEALLKIARAKK